MGDYAALAPTRAQKEFNTTTSNTTIGSSRGDIIEKQGSSTINYLHAILPFESACVSALPVRVSMSLLCSSSIYMSGLW